MVFVGLSGERGMKILRDAVSGERGTKVPRDTVSRASGGRKSPVTCTGTFVPPLAKDALALYAPEVMGRPFVPQPSVTGQGRHRFGAAIVQRRKRIQRGEVQQIAGTGGSPGHNHLATMLLDAFVTA